MRCIFHIRARPQELFLGSGTRKKTTQFLSGDVSSAKNKNEWAEIRQMLGGTDLAQTLPSVTPQIVAERSADLDILRPHVEKVSAELVTKSSQVIQILSR